MQDLTLNNQNFFTYTKLTNKSFVDEEKVTLHSILKHFGFYENRPRIEGNFSVRTKDATKNRPKVVEKFLHPRSPLPNIENEDESNDLQFERVEIPPFINAICTRLKVLVGSKQSRHTNTLIEACNLIDELYKKGEIHSEQQNRNAVDNVKSL